MATLRGPWVPLPGIYGCRHLSIGGQLGGRSWLRIHPWLPLEDSQVPCRCQRAFPRGLSGAAALAAPLLLARRAAGQGRGRLRRCCDGGPLTARQAAADNGYKTPSEDFVSLVDAPPTPSLSLDPTERWLLFMDNPPLRTIAELCRAQRKLAGLRFDPVRLLPALAGGYTRLTLRPLFGADGRPLSVEEAPQVAVDGLPAGARVRSVAWRPGGRGFAFVALPPEGAASELPELWLADFDVGGPVPSSSVMAERLLDEGGNPLRLNGIRGSPLLWHPDGQRLLLDSVPWPEKPQPGPTAGTLGGAPQVPAGPSVQVSSPGQKAPARTYQDLLASPEDEEEYEWYTTTQLLIYDVKARRAAKLGPPDMFRSLIISPDGKYLLVSMTRQPFSYLVPDGRFARDLEVWELPELGSLPDELPARWPVTSLPVRDQIPTPQDAVEACPRAFAWRSGAPHCLRFVEALDGGDPRNDASPQGLRDQIFFLDGPPFTLEHRSAGPGLEMRYSGQSTCHDGTRLLSEWRWRDRRQRTWVLPKEMEAEGGASGDDRWLLYDRSFEDMYADPGEFQAKLDENTWQYFLRQRSSDGALLLFGSGASPRGRRPFVDALRLPEARTKARALEEEASEEATSSRAPLAGAQRLWRCVAAPSCSGDPPEDALQEVGATLPPEAARREELERPATLLGGTGGEPLRLLFWREAQDTPANLFSRSLEDGTSEPEVQLTDFPHPQPALRQVRKRLVKYRRADGVELNAYLYLPPGYDKERDGRLPCLMWAYPREFKSAGNAGQIGSSPYSFVRGSWSRPLFWVLRGYAVFDDPKMPVVGEGDEEPNDTFVEQLRMSAQAAVDCVVEDLGVVDRDRICVGGHSYGAFMTAHLLAHTDLFRAGICRSGAYNRSLTPFGFQSEDRTYWEATETYTKMSPFLYAKQLAEKAAPLLLIHGDEDPNPGTLKMQSERFFQALKGHGATARLVVLPRERHGYAARESILHALAEQESWLEVHNARREPEAPEAE